MNKEEKTNKKSAEKTKSIESGNNTINNESRQKKVILDRGEEDGKYKFIRNSRYIEKKDDIKDNKKK